MEIGLEHTVHQSSPVWCSTMIFNESPDIEHLVLLVCQNTRISFLRIKIYQVLLTPFGNCSNVFIKREDDQLNLAEKRTNIFGETMNWQTSIKDNSDGEEIWWLTKCNPVKHPCWYTGSWRTHLPSPIGYCGP